MCFRLSWSSVSPLVLFALLIVSYREHSRASRAHHARLEAIENTLIPFNGLISKVDLTYSEFSASLRIAE